jgi:hypothetical protein
LSVMLRKLSVMLRKKKIVGNAKTSMARIIKKVDSLRYVPIVNI